MGVGRFCETLSTLRRLTQTPYNFLVPKLCLGMTLSRQLRCPICETEFQRQVRSQTEFGNEAAEGLAERKAKCAWLLGVKSDDGIDGAGAARGQPAGNKRDEHERRRKEQEDDRIARADPVEQRRD